VRLERALGVTLHVADLEAMPARVEDDDDETVTLVITIRPDARLASLSTLRGTLEYTTPTGMHRLSGAMARDPMHPEVLRLRRDDKGHTVQRRDNVRMDVALPVTLTLVGDDARSATTTAFNLSAGGLLVKEPFPLALGEIVDVVLELDPAAAPLELRGRVARQGAVGEKGIGIERIGRGDETRLLRYIAERQRIAMRLRRSR